ncbi:MAG: HD domain-containing protein [Thermoplasmata archaeon]
MSEVFITNWFTKKKEKPGKNCLELRNEILTNIIKQASGVKSIEDFVDGVGMVLQEATDLQYVPSDTRLPVCSLYHHLRTTTGLGVALAIENGAENRKEIAKIRLACLLHDIGKLEVFHREEKFTKHAEYTANFMKELLSKVNLGLESDEIMALVHLASRHHSPYYYQNYRAQQPLEKLISLADTIASGADRKYEVELTDEGGTLVSHDRVFPHVFKTKTGEEVVLGYNDSTKTEELAKEDVAKEDGIIFDSIIHGGLSTTPYSLPDELSKYNIALLSLDIMQIQSFIKEAKKLSALAGGSKIIKEICDVACTVIQKNTCPECILYAGGGNLLAILPASKAEEIKSEIEKEIEGRYKGFVKYVIATEQFTCAKIMDFRGAVKSIHEKVEALKAKRPERLPVVSPSSGKICEYCCRREGRALSDNKVLCEICEKKEEEGKKTLLEEEKVDRFYKELQKTGELTRELGNIGNYIAVLSFDGNMVGRLFKNTSTPAEFNFKSEEFDEKINEVLVECAKKMVSEHAEMFIHTDENQKRYVGIRKIYSGGDDILLIMNAKGALHFAKKFIDEVCEAFKFELELGTLKFSYPTVTMSCGIAYGRHDFPVYFLIEKAEELLGKAKKAFRRETKKDENGFFILPKGAIAISCITTSMPEEKDFVYVLDWDIGKLSMLMEFVERAQNDKWKSLVSSLINFENTEEGKLNFVKFLYSHMDKPIITRCASQREGGRLEVVKKIVDAIAEKEVLEYLVPMVWGDER